MNNSNCTRITLIRHLLLSALFYVSFSALGQSVSIESIVFPPTVVELKDVLGGVQVSNVANEPKYVKVNAKIFSQQGALLIQMSGGKQVGAGSDLLTDVEVANVNDYSGYLLQYIEATGFVPPGLKVCVELQVGAESSVNECSQQNTQVNFGLNLQYPYDGEEINLLRPSLFWMFAGHTEDVTYRVTLKELTAGQKKIEALNFGPMIFSVQQVREQSMDYPVELSDLKEGGQYVWQVEAFLKNLSLGITDIWKFKVGQPMDLNNLPVSRSYIDISEISGEPTVYLLGKLRLKLNEESQSGTIDIAIGQLKEKSKKVKNIGKERLDAKLGENYYDIDLDEKYSLQHKKKYTVQIRQSGQKSPKVVHFIYLNPKYVK